MARFLRLLMTLVVLVSGPLSALGGGLAGASQGRATEIKLAAPKALLRAGTAPDEDVGGRARSARAERVRLDATDVGDSATSPSDTLRPGSRSRAGLLSILSHALAADEETEDGEEDDEFEVGDAPDLFDDDCPQGFVASAFAGLSIPRLPAPCLEPSLGGIQASIGHPHGVDEPPRI